MLAVVWLLNRTAKSALAIKWFLNFLAVSSFWENILASLKVLSIIGNWECVLACNNNAKSSLFNKFTGICNKKSSLSTGFVVTNLYE